jgi:hypothetical protein
MTGFVLAFGACWTCGQPFSFNPHRVPSIRIDGVREPVCRGCMTIVNQKRVGMGLEPHLVPDDAYEALPEGEL